MRDIGVFLAIALFLAWPCWAARTVTADGPVTIRVELGQPTQVIFPEPIEHVVYYGSGGCSKDSRGECPVVNNGPYVYITPPDAEFGGRMFVLDRKGDSYPLLVKVATPSDDSVTIVKPTPTVKATPFTADSLLRALRAGVTLPSAVPAEVPAPGLPEGAPVTLQQAQTLAVGAFLGQTLTLVNATQAPVVLDIRLGETPQHGTFALDTWVWPPQLDIVRLSAQEEVIPPGHQARVFIIYQARRP